LKRAMGNMLTPDLSACVSCSESDSMDPDLLAALPNFYVNDPKLTSEVISSVQRSWNKIMHGTSRNYLYLKGTEGFPHEDSLSWFGHTFFINLFESYPSVIPLFNMHISDLGKVVVNKFDSIVALLPTLPKCATVLEDLARTHATYGVRAIQYGLFVDVFLLTLKNVLKADYTDYTEGSWIKVRSIFSYLYVAILVV
jgi:hemoglobin-like flavoprotein